MRVRIRVSAYFSLSLSFLNLTHIQEPNEFASEVIILKSRSQPNTLQHTATHCNTLQHSHPGASRLLRVGIRVSASFSLSLSLSLSLLNLTHIQEPNEFASEVIILKSRSQPNTLQHTATHCNTQQHIATLTFRSQPTFASEDSSFALALALSLARARTLNLSRARALSLSLSLSRALALSFSFSLSRSLSFCIARAFSFNLTQIEELADFCQ